MFSCQTFLLIPLCLAGKVDEKATQLHAIASLKVLLDATKPQNGRVETYRTDGLTPDPRPDNQSHVSGRSSQGTEMTHVDSLASSDAASHSGPHTNGDLQSEGNSVANNVSYGTNSVRKIPPKAPQNGDNNGVTPALNPAAPEVTDPEAAAPSTPAVSLVPPPSPRNPLRLPTSTWLSLVLSLPGKF